MREYRMLRDQHALEETSWIHAAKPVRRPRGVRRRCGMAVRLRLPPGGTPLQIQLTAVYRKVPEGFVAFVEELPAANIQGATLEEARDKLRQAAERMVEANRALAEAELRTQDEAEVIREPLRLSA